MNDSLHDAIQNLLPKSLDDVIRKHRDHVALRIATPEDKATLRRAISPSREEVQISRWNFLALETREPMPPVLYVMLVGWRDDASRPWITSPVLGIDPRRGYVFTRSGSLYRTVGESSEVIDLPTLCAWLHTTPIGEYLGVPLFTF